MPELPEVESIKLQLEKYVVGHKIEDVQIRNPKYEFQKKAVVGAKIKSVRRFAKVLVIDLSNGNSIVIHIKLTGQLIYRGPKLRTPKLSKKVLGGLGGKHTHVIFYLDKEGKLYYNDVRKFGWIKVVASNKLLEIGFLKNLGPEPFDTTQDTPFDTTRDTPFDTAQDTPFDTAQDTPFDTAQGKPSDSAQGKPNNSAQGKLPKLSLSNFIKMVNLTKRPIKTLLMDQSKISGIGNIYANDALWLAKIIPTKPANKLDSGETKRLYESIIKVLKDGLKYGGASDNSYVTPDGSDGGYQKHFLAYGQEGKLCSRCKRSKFVKIKVAGRGTVYCPQCQKE